MSDEFDNTRMEKLFDKLNRVRAEKVEADLRKDDAEDDPQLPEVNSNGFHDPNWDNA